MYYLLCVKWFVGLFTLEKNSRFTAFLDSNFHTRLAIVTENELGLAFPPRNLLKKFRPDPSTFYLVILATNRQTNRQTDTQTNAGDYIIPGESYRGDNKAAFGFLRTLTTRYSPHFASVVYLRNISHLVGSSGALPWPWRAKVRFLVFLSSLKVNKWNWRGCRSQKCKHKSQLAKIQNGRRRPSWKIAFQ